MTIFKFEQPGMPAQWSEYHYHSWCPFCFLGWPRDQAALAAGQCCSIWSPRGLMDMHVPAFGFDRENPEVKILAVFMARPWEIRTLAAAGIDPRRARKVIPGLAEAFVRERAACPDCQAFLARNRVPCRRHGVRVQDDQDR